MKNKPILLLVFFFFITGIFFYKFFLFGKVPFPGDLLISEYNPWKTYSYQGYVPGSYPNKAQYFDVIRQLYPWKTFVIEAFKGGTIPFWNPYNFSGSPLLANFQSAAFYPLNILYFLLPQITAWSILVMLQPLLASIFTYFYAKKIGISVIGSLFTAISFAFSSFLTVWLEYNTIGHVILWFPLLLLAVEYLLEKRNLLWSLVFTFSLSSSLFAGHPQIFIYILMFLFIYFFYRIKIYKYNKNLEKKSIFLIFALVIISLGIGAIQIIPGLELINNSARSSHSYEFLVQKILIQPWQFIMLFVPDFFGNPATRNYWLLDTYVGKVTSIGLISVIFSFLSIKNYKNKYVIFFIISTVIVFLFSSLNPLTLILYKLPIPLLSTSSPTLSIFIASFSLSILAGFGVDIFLKEKLSLKNYLIWILPILIIFISLWLFVLVVPQVFKASWFVNLSISFRNLFYSTIILSLALTLIFFTKIKHKFSFIIIFLLFFIQVFDLWKSFEKFNPFVSKEFIFPKTSLFAFLEKEAGVNRFWGYGTASIEANFSTQYALFSPDGYDPLYPKRYGEFIQSSKNGKIENKFNTQTRSDAFIAGGFGENDLPLNEYRLKVIDSLGVRYIIDRFENKSTEKTFPEERFKLVFEDNGWKVYENLKAAPRAFLTSNYQIFKTKEEFEKIFFSKSFDLTKTVLFEKDIQFKDLEINNNIQQKVSFESYLPNKVVIKTKSSSNTFLVLSDSYYPGWKAFIDNKAVPIYRANYAFRAVPVTKGEHTIVFQYDSFSFRLGLIISIASMVGLLFFIIVVLRKPNFFV